MSDKYAFFKRGSGGGPPPAASSQPAPIQWQPTHQQQPYSHKQADYKQQQYGRDSSPPPHGPPSPRSHSHSPSASGPSAEQQRRSDDSHAQQRHPSEQQQQQHTYGQGSHGQQQQPQHTPHRPSFSQGAAGVGYGSGPSSATNSPLPAVAARLQPVSIPSRHSQQQQQQQRQQQPDPSAGGAGGDRPLRRRLASPSAAEPEPSAFPQAFPANLGPSPRAAAVSRQQVAELGADGGKMSAVSTPGGNNVVFQMGGGKGHAGGGGEQVDPSAGARVAQGPPVGLDVPSNPFASPQHSNPLAHIPNPFANHTSSGSTGVTARMGKRKHSDPELHDKYSKSFGGKKNKKHPHSSSWSSKLSAFKSSIGAPFVSLWRHIRPDTKKDDDVRSLGAVTPTAGGAAGFGRHKFSAANNGREESASLLGRSNTMLRNKHRHPILRHITCRNLSFFLVLSLLLSACFIWYTHDCDEELEEDEDFSSHAMRHYDGHWTPGQGGGHLDQALHEPLNPASEPGVVVVNPDVATEGNVETNSFWSDWSMDDMRSSVSSTLSGIEEKYPFLHPVLHFFKRPIDHTGHAHVASVSQPKIPFTIFSLLRDMTPEFLAEKKESYIFQYNALLSWVRLTKHVLVYMDTQEACDALTARSEFKSVQCYTVPCMHDSVPRPLLNCIFEHAHEVSTTEAMGFVNGDIILSSDIRNLVTKIGNEFEKYLVVSKRTDTTIPDHLIDAFLANMISRARSQRDGGAFIPAVVKDPSTGQLISVEDNVATTIQFAEQHGELHSEYGIDLFLYPKSTFRWMFPSFPAFLAGVYRWDNYFLTKMILHPSVVTIDASRFGLLIHQQVDGGQDHGKRTGAPINDALVKQHLGNVYKLGHINNVDYVLRGPCPTGCEITPNVNASVAVLYAKRANEHNWMGVIHVNAGEGVELNNFLCWTRRSGFRNFIFLTRDRDMYEEIVTREMPVIFLDRTLVEPTPTSSSTSTTKPSDEESAAGTLQRYDFLMSILKAGYHFYYASVRHVFLDDPLKGLPNTPTPRQMLPGEVDERLEPPYFDVQVRGNLTHMLSAPFAGPLAVRSSTYGQYFWKQVHDCADMNKHIADRTQWLDCIAHNWKVLKGAMKKGVFNEFDFPSAAEFFTEKAPLLSGHYPRVIADVSVRDNVDKFARLASWGLMATKASSPTCKDDLPSAARVSKFSPPTAEPTLDFRFKVRVLTFNRHASLKRLLDALQAAHYDNDRVDLEISIDYPLNMSDTSTISEWSHTQLVARSFTWGHGSIKVIQQPTHVGLTGQWTQGWIPPEDNKEIVLFLEDDTGVSPYYYTFCKKMIQTYYLNPHNYDPNLYGFALQTQHTILGERVDARYGTRQVPDLLNATAQAHGLNAVDSMYFRYQLVGTWGGVFFPQHWREFLIWLREKGFIHAQGVSTKGFEPCVPSLVSNTWWEKKPHKVWSQWFVRFAFEKGWYNMYTNYPDQLSLVGNFREGGENFAVTKGLMNDMVDEINTPPGSPLYNHLHEPNTLPLPSSKLPLFDFHFNEVTHPEGLRHRLAVWGQKESVPQCITIQQLLKQQKDAANKLKAKLEAKKKEAEKQAALKAARAKGKSGAAPKKDDKAILQELEKTMNQLSKDGSKPADTKSAEQKKKEEEEKKKKEAEAKKKKEAEEKKKKEAEAAKKKAEEEEKRRQEEAEEAAKLAESSEPAEEEESSSEEPIEESSEESTESSESTEE